MFHSVLLLAALVTVYSSVQSNQVLAQEIGKRSLLYTLMTNGESEIVQDGFYIEDVQPNEKLLGEGTIQAIPHIDFDYSLDEDGDYSLASNLPSTIVLRPMTEEDGKAEGPVKTNRTGVETYVVKMGDTL
ncbi:hypothetical protein KKG46_04010, partial [Patescibacteria group bacterium]|nr:hypothetical protein [Patescibacteria group bacterium]